MPKQTKPTTEEALLFQEATMASRPPDLLKRIAALAQLQLDLEAKGKELEQQAKDNNKELERIRGGHQQEGELPQALQEAEMTEFTLQNGAVIKVEEVLMPPSLAKDSPQRLPLLKWIEDNKHGDSIKNSIVILFAKGDERVPEVEKHLQELALPYDNFATMHPGTLKALLNELLEAGEDVPLEELGIKVFRQSKVK